MKIKSIELKDFRNYESCSISLSDQTNILFGDNAQGKTNLLEAAYMSATTKSHRKNRDREMIRFGCEEAHIKTIVQKGDRDYRIDIHLKKNGRKGIAINRIPVKRARELLGIVNIIFFSPENLNIIKNGPSHRRRFLDMELCQLDKIYLSSLSNYNKALNQRNRLLKDIAHNPSLTDTLDIWDDQLVKYGCDIIKRRSGFIEDMKGIVRDIHNSISGGREDLDLSYEPSVVTDSFADTLKQNRQKDLRYYQTSCGPHRDDLKMSVDGVDMRTFGSQGQQRTCALSLKLSEITLVKNTIGEEPVLLLDDVLSELDSNRQNYLLEKLTDTQTIITCTGLDDFVKNRFKINRTFKIISGTVKEL